MIRIEHGRRQANWRSSATAHCGWAAFPAAIAPYLTKPNYVRTWLEDGFAQGDLADGGSDRFVDSLVAWGSADVVARRVLAHLEAGADHVALHIVADTPHTFPLTAWRAVAERLPRSGT